MNKKQKTDYKIDGRKVEPIICMYCCHSGLEGSCYIEDLGYCIKCKTYYSSHVENPKKGVYYNIHTEADI